ncbi:hypothetical protein ACFVIM_08240 [Streptomyces sp. NPDC057638]|uniref:hypothetical protein n=1 Tax=Streptomyces sp. NPDC057638 TaxID=3346190 RepID=UPI00369D7043
MERQTARGGAETAAPYTDAARARLVMAYEACELADLARAVVPVGGEELGPDGTTRAPGRVLADAADVLAAARRFFEAAVVFERMAGADWQLIGDVLGVPARTGRARFARAEAGFGARLTARGADGPAGAAGEVGPLRDYMVREPLETALDLDEWVLRHRDGDSGLGRAPVSGGLAPKECRRGSGVVSGSPSDGGTGEV